MTRELNRKFRAENITMLDFFFCANKPLCEFLGILGLCDPSKTQRASTPVHLLQEISVVLVGSGEPLHTLAIERYFSSSRCVARVLNFANRLLSQASNHVRIPLVISYL